MFLIDQVPKLLLASFIGILLGIERLKKGKPAGISTYSIICMTSCLLTILSMYGFGSGGDPSRLIANIITAIGFVTGGVVFTKSGSGTEEDKIVGLTTGATVFAASAMGIGIGIGAYLLVIIVVIIIEINIFLSNFLKKFINEDINEEKDEL